MIVRILAAATLLSAVAAIAAPVMAQDAPATGEAFFNQKCKACHNDTPTARGPKLNGVFNRKIAGAAGYEYSDGLKAKTGKWTEANLDAYLTDPKAFAPGGKMPSKVADADQRKMVIGYLKTFK
jgi:cytochrome c